MNESQLAHHLDDATRTTLGRSAGCRCLALLAYEDVLYSFKPARRAAAGGNDLVFPNTVGRPINPSNFLLPKFYPLLRDAILPRMRSTTFATVRRPCCSGWAFIPKVVSEMLGHTRIGLTLDLYSHVTATMQQQAVTALDDLFGDLER